MNNSKSKTILPFVIIAAVLQIIWGLTPTASKIVIDEIPVELYITLRWSISGFIFFSYLILKRIWKPIRFFDCCRISLLGILGYGVGSFGTLYGLKLGGVAYFSLVASINPIIMAFFSVLILKERPLKSVYFALMLSVCGLTAVILGKYRISTSYITLLCTFSILGAYICESLVFVYSKKFNPKVDTFQYLAITHIATATTMWTIQGLTFHQTSEISKLSAHGLSALIFVSVVSCVLCYAVLYWLLKYIEGHQLALFDGIHTVSTFTFGYLFFHEPLNPIMLIGGTTILVAMLWGTHNPALTWQSMM